MSHQESDRKAAAFYDLDGTLVRTNVIHTFLSYAVQHPSLWRKLSDPLRVFGQLPRFAVMNQWSRKGFNTFFYRFYRGFTEDRIYLLGEEIAEKMVRKSLYPFVKDLIYQHKHMGMTQVLVTGALDSIAAPLCARLKMDYWVANRLEFQNGLCTGRLLPPIVAGSEKAKILTRFAREHSLDLENSWAFADSYSDIPMLSVVGRPVVVNPDPLLKRHASDYHWPVLNVADGA